MKITKAYRYAEDCWGRGSLPPEDQIVVEMVDTERDAVLGRAYWPTSPSNPYQGKYRITFNANCWAARRSLLSPEQWADDLMATAVHELAHLYQMKNIPHAGTKAVPWHGSTFRDLMRLTRYEARACENRHDHEFYSDEFDVVRATHNAEYSMRRGG